MDTLQQLQDIKKFKKVLFTKFGDDGATVTEDDFVLPELKENQFIVKVFAAPIGPLDLLKISGKFSGLQTPFTPGTECSGVIIAAKKEELKGKKVSMFVREGSFRQYCIGNEKEAIFLPDDTDLTLAACLFVNPITCYGMLDITLNQNVKAIINTAANSQLGRMIYRSFTEKGISVINLVRSKVEEFKKEMNAQYVLDITSETFEVELKKLSAELKVGICWDCYGGDLSGSIFNSLPAKGKTYQYGSLISPFINKINGVELRWGDKEIHGFTLFHWLVRQNDEKLEALRNFIVERRNDLFLSSIQKQFPIDEFSQALEYYRGNMSGGKVVILM